MLLSYDEDSGSYTKFTLAIRYYRMTGTVVRVGSGFDECDILIILVAFHGRGIYPMLMTI